MTTQGIRSTQQLANAAEAFVTALQVLFPDDTFDQFFDVETIRRAYWTVLQDVLDSYSTPLGWDLMKGQVLADSRVVAELLKLFLPGETPDYLMVAAQWQAALHERPETDLLGEVQTLFTLLANELRRSPDLRLALLQLAQVRLPGSKVTPPGDDLQRLLDAALVAGPGNLSRQIRHLLALVSGRDSLPGAAGTELMALARLGSYLPPASLQIVWERVAALEDPSLRLQILSLLAPCLSRLDQGDDPLALIQETIAAHTRVLDPVQCVYALLNLAPHLESLTPDEPLVTLRQRMLASVQAINDPASRVRALSVLIGILPPELQHEAVSLAFETAAQQIPSEPARASALSVLPPTLPPEFFPRLMAIARDLESPDARALLLGRMLPHLPESLQLQALGGALAAIETISGDEARAGALITLAPSIDAVGSLRDLPGELRQVITVIFSIERQDERARAFAALAPYLSPELLSESMQAIKSIEDDGERAATLAKLAPHLSDDLSRAAFMVARELLPPDARALALAALAPNLLAMARAEALGDALAAALAIEDRYSRVVALVDLESHLTDDLRRRALLEALRAARSIPDEGERRRALVYLVPHLLDDQLADALADAYTIIDPVERGPALSALLPQLPPNPRHTVARDVIALARSVDSPPLQASILAAVAPVLPDHLLDEAIEAARKIDTPYDRLHVLTALLPRRPDQLHPLALAAARAVTDQDRRAGALLELVPYTPPELRYTILHEALAVVLQVQDDYDRASGLANLAPYVDLQNDVRNRRQVALSLALDTCLTVSEPGIRAVLFAQLGEACVKLLSPAQCYTLWRRLVLAMRLLPYAQALADLAALAPMIDYMGAPAGIDVLAEALLSEIGSP